MLASVFQWQHVDFGQQSFSPHNLWKSSNIVCYVTILQAEVRSADVCDAIGYISERVMRYFVYLCYWLVYNMKNESLKARIKNKYMYSAKTSHIDNGRKYVNRTLNLWIEDVFSKKLRQIYFQTPVKSFASFR